MFFQFYKPHHFPLVSHSASGYRWISRKMPLITLPRRRSGASTGGDPLCLKIAACNMDMGADNGPMPAEKVETLQKALVKRSVGKGEKEMAPKLRYDLVLCQQTWMDEGKRSTLKKLAPGDVAIANAGYTGHGVPKERFDSAAILWNKETLKLKSSAGPIDAAHARTAAKKSGLDPKDLFALNKRVVLALFETAKLKRNYKILAVSSFFPEPPPAEVFEQLVEVMAALGEYLKVDNILIAVNGMQPWGDLGPFKCFPAKPTENQPYFLFTTAKTLKFFDHSQKDMSPLTKPMLIGKMTAPAEGQEKDHERIHRLCEELEENLKRKRDSSPEADGKAFPETSYDNIKERIGALEEDLVDLFTISSFRAQEEHSEDEAAVEENGKENGAAEENGTK